MPKSWGKIMLGVRLEKMVEAPFVRSWSNMLAGGLRQGDRWELTEGMTAHSASNTLVCMLLKSDCDSLLMVDSDGDFETDFISKLRDHEDGWQFDALQAFYLRRGWPPDPIWFKRDAKGVLHNCVIFGETTEDVALIGTHCVIIRREVFEKLLGDKDPDEFDWFYYPRHQKMTEDAAFSEDALAAGFRLGATSHVKANHLSHLSVGWDAYQEYLQTSGKAEQVARFDELLGHIVKFTGETSEQVIEKMKRGNDNVLQAWNKHNPDTLEKTHEFYGADDNGYLYDLLNWNCSLNYVQLTRPLEGYHGRKVLVIGSGLGTEAAILSKNNQVDVFELPGVLKRFCKSRLNGNVNYLEGDTLQKALTDQKYDLIVAIDVLEHFHPDEFNLLMDKINKALVPQGEMYMHNNFEQQDLYPMHFNHSEKFSEWAKEKHITQVSNYVWMKEK